MPAMRVTMRQIAEAAGVSRTTVSFVLNCVPDISISAETRRRVLEAAQAMNYVPNAAARSLASQRAGAVALVLRQSPRQVFRDERLARVIQGIVAAVRDYGFHIIVEPLGSDSTVSYGNLVRSHRAEGVLLSGLRFDDDQLLPLQESAIPVVLIGQVDNTTLPFVDVDNAAGALKAVKHLIEMGHRRIACITNAPLSYTASRDRLAGYRQALEQAGIVFDERLVRIGLFTEVSGAQAMENLLGSGQTLDAVFVASDEVALGALTAIQAAGLHVPDDLALVGFDDIPQSRYVDPPLTTIRLPAYDLGYQAGGMLTRLIETPQDGVGSLLLETELIVRQSSGHVSMRQ
jgi:DNA-binding LacI/PurR family transcriptional regulator